MPGTNHLLELIGRERGLLRGSLHFDESPASRHDEVHVDLGGRILAVIEVEERFPFHDADADGGNAVRKNLSRARGQVGVSDGVRECDKSARDTGGPRPTVGVQNVTIDPNRPTIERLQIHHGPQASADEPLDFDRSPIGLPFVASFSGRSGAGEHAVFRRQPTLPFSQEPIWDLVVETGGAKDSRPPHFDENASRGVSSEAASDLNRAVVLSRGASVISHVDILRNKGWKRVDDTFISLAKILQNKEVEAVRQ